MGFFLQLKLLLWKNFTLKKRKPVMLVFEVIIPLVLFVILIGIRNKKPASQYPAAHFPAWPLPSSGLVAILQSFCEDSNVGAGGFQTHPNSRVHEVLVQFNTLAQNNNFFQPEFSVAELGEIPINYKRFVEDPIKLKTIFEGNNTEIPFSFFLSSPNEAQDFLVRNISFDSGAINYLFHNTTINTANIFKLLFHNPTLSSFILPAEPNSTKQVPNHDENYELGEHGLIYSFLNQNGDTYSHLFQHLTRHTLPIPTPVQLAETLKDIFLSTELMDLYICSYDSVGPLIECNIADSSLKNDCQNKLQKLWDQYCTLNFKKKAVLKEYLYKQINSSNLSQKIRENNWNATSVRDNISTLAKNFKTFLVFKKSIHALSEIAHSLPRDYCFPQLNETDEETSTELLEKESPHRTNHLVGGSGTVKTKKSKPRNKKVPNAFSSIWKALQKTVCGKEYHYNESVGDSFDEMGLSESQQSKVELLFHILYNNPKVLYAPSGTEADKIIVEANTTFYLFDLMNQYAKRMVEVGTELKDYLDLESTAINLNLLSEIHKDLQQSSLRKLLVDEPSIEEFLNDTEIRKREEFLKDLDTISLAACSWTRLTSGIHASVFMGFPTEDKLIEYFQDKATSDNVTVLAGVIFHMNDDNSLPNHMIYKIRQNATLVPPTDRVRARFWFPGPRSESISYYKLGFVWVQDAMERAMINLYANKNITSPGSYIQQMPYPCYTHDAFLFVIQHVMPMFLTVSWVYSVAMLVQHIVYEKETKLKEVMKMMGLRNRVHWIAWFISSFLQMTVTVAIMTLMLKFGKVLRYSDPWLVFATLEVYAATIIMFSFLVSVLYSKAKIAAACAGIVYFMSYIPYMYISVQEETANEIVPGWVKGLASLLAPTAFGLGAKYFAFYEVIGTGVQWNNYALSPAEDDEYHLGYVVLMLTVDTVLYGVLVWYIENVHPGTIGIPKPWYFPFQKSYWFDSTKKRKGAASTNCMQSCWGKPTVLEQESALLDLAQINRDNELFEADPENLPLGVSIVQLSKRYKGAVKYALKNLNLNFYEGQITALLGHNGAGKTTTISILTGLFPSTSGQATIYDRNISENMDLIRNGFLGMCPQHNVLFDDLTVDEHMWFYSRLKGNSKDEFDEETEKLISELNLPERRNQKVEYLSGGMKRKLSVAIAFVGGSKTVILDEPTAGIDPYARRAIWDLIIKYKHGRTIILTTHHMDEADILSDRIAIMQDGRLKCCGSPIYLKQHLGKGYYLSIVKNKTLDQRQPRPYEPQYHRKTLSKFIRNIVPSARVTKESKHEIHFVLPLEDLQKFPELFKGLEESKTDLLISSYGLKNTTLEEIFLSVVAERRDSFSSVSSDSPLHSTSNYSPRICQLSHVPVEEVTSGICLRRDEPEQDNHNANTINPNLAGLDVESLKETNTLLPSACNKSGSAPKILKEKCKRLDSNVSVKFLTPKRQFAGEGETTVEGKSLFLQQFCAIIAKRYYCTRRNIEGLVTQILLPAFFVSVAMSVALAAPKVMELPELILSPSQYYNLTQPHGNVIPYSNSYSDFADFQSYKYEEAMSEQIMGTLFLPSGVGATCVLISPYEESLNMNFSDYNADLDSKYFDSMCQGVFRPGTPLANFVPIPPTVSFEQEFLTDPKSKFTINDDETLQTQTSFQRKYPICRCNEEKTGFVCPTYGYIDPKSINVVTNDILIDITGQNESQYYLYTANMFRLRRYGGLSFGHIREMVPPDFGQTAPKKFRTVAVRHAAKVMYNNKGYHAMPTYLNVMNNAILRANLHPSKGNPGAYGITLISHPFPNTQSYFSYDEILQGNDVLIAIFIIVAMSFVPASFVLYLVYEKAGKAKHLQIICGVHRGIYWFANYVWDICSYTFPATFCIGILLIFDIPAYTSKTNFPAVVLLFFFYGWSITPMMYPATFLFKEPSSAYICMIVLNLFVGITCLITSFLLEIFSDDYFLRQVYFVLKEVFLIFPNYCLGRGLMDVAFNEYYNGFYEKSGQFHKIKSPFAWELVTKNLVVMGFAGIVFFLITLMCEFRVLKWFKSNEVPHIESAWEDEDEDVLNERKRVQMSSITEDVLHVKNLVKIYRRQKAGKLTAVNSITWALPPGECFGLLGVNSAGKTTTFRLLTGEKHITSGDAYINGFNVKTQRRLTHKHIGYCPQFDALYDELTPREHLSLYARLRGVPRKELEKVVSWGLKKIDLMSYADRPCGILSGGNKRKVSTAIALIGGPSLIFLDEPTTGMDPYSKRFLWDLITNLVAEGRSIVFTSHSMEECEALCTRLAIMVNGKFKCLGSTQHLKNRFGSGYSINLRSKDDKDTRKLHRGFKRIFPNAKLKERHHNSLHYEISSEFCHLDEIFQKLIDAPVTELPILDYSVSQNTLDNVFINFVKNQMDCEEDPIVINNTSHTRNPSDMSIIILGGVDSSTPIASEQVEIGPSKSISNVNPQASAVAATVESVAKSEDRLLPDIIL